jgi:predicted phosphoribosyltransferase
LIFKDRIQAGQMLGDKLRAAGYGSSDILLGIPRGGVVVGYHAAERLDAVLDIIVPRKIGAPFNSEFAIGAVMEDGSIYLNRADMQGIGITNEYIKSETSRQIEEIKRRIRFYRKSRPRPDVSGKTVIIVDDGIATGATIKAASISLKKMNPARLCVAAPVGAPDSVGEISKIVDDVVLLYLPDFFAAVGQFYQDFSQTSDEEVIELLELSWKKKNNLRGVDDAY